MKTILLLGAGMGSPDAVARLKSLGLRIILVELRHLFALDKCEAADEIIITDYREESFIAFAAGLRETWAFDVVVSITEAGVPVAALLNRKFGMRGSNVHALPYLNNKAKMRKLLHESGFSDLEYEVIESRSDLAGIVGRAGFPLILKPVDGGGSCGIHLVNSVEEAVTAFNDLTAQGHTVLAEQYVDGKEYSVESFSFNGKHIIAAITAKVVNERFVEIGHVVPAMLDEPVAEEVRRFVGLFLDIVGVTNGPCHTEMKIGSQGMKIIESHNRIGGGNISKLVLLAYGVDLVKLTGEWACGLGEPMRFDPVPQGAAAIHFFIFPAGKIVALDGLRQVENDPSTVEYRCNYGIGDAVPALADNSGRGGYVVVHEKTSEEAIEKATLLARGVTALTCQA